MSQTIFLSTVSNEFGGLRTRLARVLQRTNRVHVRHQNDFVERGVLTLQRLQEEIEASHVVLHVIGADTGAAPPLEQSEALLDRLHDFETRFPEIAELARQRQVSYTQWEAWLALYFDKRLCCYQVENRLPPADLHQPPSPSQQSQRDHAARLRKHQCYPKQVANEDGLYDEIILTLIELKLLTEQEARPPISLPYPSLGRLFIGREAFLADLRTRFEQARRAGHWPRHAIYGLGGVGKTRLVVEYAWRHQDQYVAVLMVNAESPASLDRALASLAGVLHASLDLTLPEPDRLKATLDWLRRHPGWLLLVDNVDTEAARQAVAGRLPDWTAGHVVITGRVMSWPRDVAPLDLDVLAPEDAQRFLLEATVGRRRAQADDVQQARLLGEEDLGGLCLALEQAAAYIGERGVSLAEYRHRWATNARNVRAWADSFLMRYHEEREVSLSVATTWQVTVDQLQPAARTLLEMLAWLASDPLPQGLLDHPETAAQVRSASGVLEADVEEALAELRRYSLLSHPDETQPHSAGQVHRLVQLITRDWLSDAQRRTTLVAMLAAANAYTPTEGWDVRTWPALEPLRPHVARLLEHAEQAQITDPTTRLMSVLGAFFRAKALYAQAEPLYRRTLAIAEQAYGPEHPRVAIRLNNLAQLLQDTNRLAAAEPLMRRALAIDEQAYGAEHPDVARDLNNLAQLLQATNQLAAAEPLMRRALAIDEQAYGAEHPDVAIDLNNLAQLLQDTNRLAAAEPLMRRALAIDEQAYGAEHPTVAARLNNLAQLLQATDRLAAAEPLMRRALAIDEQAYGAEHPTVATGLNNLAQLLQATDRLAAAEPLMRRALAIDEQAYGAEHPTVAIRLNNLALLLKVTNRLAAAEPLMRRALAIDEQAYGAEHPNIATSLNNLAQLLKVTNRLAAAEPLFHRMAAIFYHFGQHTGHKHPYMQTGLENYRRLLHALAVPSKEIERRVQAALQTPGPLEPITPEVERLLGPVQPVQAALDAQYQQDNKPAVWFLPPDQPIAPHLDELLGPSALNVPLDQPIDSYLENLLGPARSTKEMLDALDRQYREQGKSAVWFLPPARPIVPYLDELLGPSTLNVPLEQPIASHLENLLGPARPTQEVLDTLDRQYREQGKTAVWFLASDEPISPHLDELLGPVEEENTENGQA